MNVMKQDWIFEQHRPEGMLSEQAGVPTPKAVPKPTVVYSSKVKETLAFFQTQALAAFYERKLVALPYKGCIIVATT
jgi:hypothetical protein